MNPILFLCPRLVLGLILTLSTVPVCSGEDATKAAPASSPSPLALFLANAGVGAKASTVSEEKNPFLRAQGLPASFVYGGQSSRDLLTSWPKEDKPPVLLPDRTIYEITWREPNGGLVATWRAEAFKDWPAVEFRWIFSNAGQAPTKALTAVEALDLNPLIPNGPVQIIHCSGGLDADIQDPNPGFALAKTWTPCHLVLSGSNGRSSDKDLPFFLLHERISGQGIFVGVGWSGQWQSTIDVRDPQHNPFHITAEMPGMNLALPPHEQIVSPSILLGAYSGEWTTGSNLLRQILFTKYVPLLSGKKPLPPISWNSWFILENNISEEKLKAQADAAAAAGIDYFCIDAGWFDGGFPNGVGNWTIDKTKFPSGLGPIGKYVTEKGMKLGLWFEPERVAGNTRVASEHPEWIHGGLLDFGNPAAREWVFQMMKQYIDEAQVRWIRWDFNMGPLGPWNQMDAADQKGLAQIRHIMGLYEVLDRLMKAYPDLLIEGCASGGRRIDLETMRRSHTFWKSDKVGNIDNLRFHETGGNVFLPGGMLNVNLLPQNIPTDIQSIFGGPLGLRCDWTKVTPEQSTEIHKLIDQYKELRPLLNEDYYSLFPQHRDESGWIGWQFNSPVQGEGFIVVIRSKESPYPSALIGLKGLDATATYAVTSVGNAAITPTDLTGAQLGKDWRIDLGGPDTAQVIHYKKKP